MAFSFLSFNGSGGGGKFSPPFQGLGFSFL